MLTTVPTRARRLARAHSACGERRVARPRASPAPSAREVPSAQIASRAITSVAQREPASSAPQVPTRIARRAPSSISSCSTIAADGPPMPVAWIVSGSPSARGARVAPQAAVVVEHARLLEQRLRQHQRAAGVAGQQHALGELRCGAQVDGLAVRQGGDSRLEGEMRVRGRTDARPSRVPSPPTTAVDGAAS